MTKEKRAGVYRIKNLIDGKVYYGSSANKNKDIESRLANHKKGKSSNINLQNAIKKYGIVNFIFEILIFCNRDECLKYEQILLNLVRIKDKFGNLGEIDKNLAYNISPTAGNLTGTKRSEETKKKLSNNNKGKHPSEETIQKLSIASSGKNNAMFGKHHSEEIRQKIRENLPDQSGENNSFWGKHHTDETKSKMSKKRKGCGKGQDNYNAKLTWEKVNEIRNQYILGEPLKNLAKEFKVCYTTIRYIIKNKIWIK